MKKIYPTELIDFLQCRHITTLKKQGVEEEEVLSEEVELLRQKGLEHEKAFLDSLEGEVVQIDLDIPQAEQKKLTAEALEAGADYIYQAYLENDRIAGYPDFLEKISKPSQLGEYSYAVLDTKLANRPSPANAVQLIHYSEIAKEMQGTELNKLEIVHGDNSRTKIKKADYFEYYIELLDEYEAFIKGNEVTEPFPIAHCRHCRYQKHCKSYWLEKDHLAGIKNIKISQVSTLNEAEIKNVSSLGSAQYKESFGLPRSQFEDLKSQAKSQLNLEICVRDPSAFVALKHLKSGGVLLTLFHNIQKDNGAAVFYAGLKTFPGERFEEIFINDRESEKEAFQRLISFIVRYIDKRPGSRVVVWSGASIKMIHDLSNSHNICHDEVDSLIFDKKLFSLQSLIHNALYTPNENNSLQSMNGLFCGDKDKIEKLDKSPQILKELFISAGVKNAESLISERARIELESVELLAKKFSDYEIGDFPVKLSLEN